MKKLSIEWDGDKCNNFGWVRILKEAVVEYFRPLFRHSIEETEENLGKPDSW